jgi:hypothetical protein
VVAELGTAGDEVAVAATAEGTGSPMSVEATATTSAMPVMLINRRDAGVDAGSSMGMGVASVGFNVLAALSVAAVIPSARKGPRAMTNSEGFPSSGWVNLKASRGYAGLGR